MNTPDWLLNKVLVGPRCTICGTLISTSNLQWDRRCNACEAVTDEDSLVLMDVAEDLRRTFVDFLGRNPNASSDSHPRLTAPQQQRLNGCQLLTCQCFVSQNFMKSKIETDLIKSDRVNVLEVREVEVGTAVLDDGIRWSHHLHFVRIDGDRTFCLDLTGTQFGPEWPLLQPWAQLLSNPRITDILGKSAFGRSYDFGYARQSVPAASSEYALTRGMSLFGKLLRKRPHFPHFPPERDAQPSERTNFETAAQNAMDWYTSKLGVDVSTTCVEKVPKYGPLRPIP
ncbi:hypothetical protein K491DRAFT_743524 [Lophiostoma macrostomum CBS 122681]|uniref:Uncharacterized protein n=1 Tax=Lophiostoma macrostomum CBS 122681 TaxID=1314788 RepID=A0A6A6TAY5_9PLEO|nr:hypothetical protein K491DRAFT_743524 [Lophiostoma macrostomum CBS 122681]